MKIGVSFKFMKTVVDMQARSLKTVSQFSLNSGERTNYQNRTYDYS